MPHILQRLCDLDRRHITLAHVQQVGRADQARVGAGQWQTGVAVGLQQQLRAEEAVVFRGPELDRRNAADTRVAHQAGHQRQLAELALQRERGLQHHPGGVVLLAGVLPGEGVEGIWNVILGFIKQTRRTGVLESRRGSQTMEWVKSMTDDYIRTMIYSNPRVQKCMDELSGQVMSGEMPPTLAAKELIDTIEAALKA